MKRILFKNGKIIKVKEDVAMLIEKKWRELKLEGGERIIVSRHGKTILILDTFEVLAIY